MLQNWFKVNWKNNRNRTATAAQRSILRYLRALHIVWSLVRRQGTQRLTRLQTMYNVLKFSEKMMELCQKVNLQETQRNRNATAIFVILIMTSTVGDETLGWR